VDLATIGIKADTRDLARAESEINKLGATGGNVERKLNQNTKGITDGFEGINKAIKAATAALVAFGVVRVLQNATTVSREFEKAISNLSAVTGAVGDDLKYFTEASKELGRTSTLTASQVAEAFKLIASAKPDLLDSASALKEVTTQAITLAEAAGITVPESANALGNSLNQFGANANEAARFINVLAAGAKFGASAITDTTLALKVAGTVASNAGVSFEEINAHVQALAAVGVKGAEAGTSLRNVLLKLSTGASETNPEVVGLTGALKALGGQSLSTTELTKLFGLENVAAANALIKAADATAVLTDKLTGTSEAIKQASINTNNLDGDMLRLASAYEAVQIQIGESSSSGLRESVQDLTKLLSDEKFAKSLTDLASGLVKVATWAAKGAVAITDLVQASGEVAAEFAIQQEEGGRLYNMLTLTNPIGLIFAGVQANIARETRIASDELQTFSGKLGDIFPLVTAYLDEVTTGEGLVQRQAKATAQAAGVMMQFAVETKKAADKTVELTDALTDQQKSLIEKTNLIKQENDLLRLGYDLEDAKFIAAYAHADDMTKALMRVQREQQGIIDGYKDEEAVLKGLSDYTEQLIQDQIDAAKAATKAAADAAKEAAGSMDDFLNGSFGDGLAEGFNQGSKALASFIDGFGELINVQEAYAAAKADASADDAKRAKAAALYQSAQIGLYGDMAAASKQFFDEGSKGYKTLQAAEVGFRAIELALAAKSAIAKGVNAVLTQGEGDPYTAFGRMAAMAATVAGLGVVIGGIGGGGISGSSTSRPDSNYDGSQGVTAGNTVLGDVKAQSESISSSLELLTDIGDSQLGYTAQMVSSLRNIEQSMVGFTAVLAQFPNWSSGAPLAAHVADPTSEYGYRSNARPTVGQVVGGNETAVLEAILQQSMSDQTRSVYEAALPLAALYEQTIADIFDVARDGFVTLGNDVSNFDAAVNDLILPIFNIDASLAAEEQNKQIAAYFSSVGDSIVAIIDPTITQFQLAGEGALETLSRVAVQMLTLRDAADSLGSYMGADGDLIGVADALSRLAGGVDEFTANVNDFLEFSLTDAEQFARMGSSVAALFDGLNKTLPSSRDGVADLVRALDLTSDSGQRAFTTITSASDLLDDYYSQLEDYTKSAYDFDTAFGVNDGSKALRDALAAVGQNFDVVETAAQGGVSALAELFSGLTDVQKAGLEPFADAILGLIPAAQQAAEAIDNSAATLSERLRLEGQLLQLQGDTDELRRREREALFESNRALYDQINALQDQAAAAQYAAQAEQALAAERARIDQERYNLETQLLQTLGDVDALRERERNAIDESNRALYDQIKALEDQQAAAAAAAAAQQAAAQAAEQAQQAMLAAMQQIAQERSSLELQLLQLQGNTAEIRARERSALDVSNRALYDQIKALEDQATAASAAAAAQQEANQRISEAESALKSAFSSESSALQSSINQFDNIEHSLRDFARSFGAVGSGGVSLNQLRNQFADVSRRAQLGDVSALESLPTVGTALRDAVASNASSAVELAREYAKIQSASYAAAEVAGRQKSIAELQLDQLTNQVSALIDINDSVLSVRDAIQNLSVAQVPGFASGGSHAGGLRIVGEHGPELEFTGPSHIISNSNSRQLLNNAELIAEIRALRAENNELRAETKRGLYQIAKNTGRTALTLDQWDGDGLPEERVL